MAINRLWLVRHGESVGNVSATHAESSGAETIQIDYRDADVPLSATGEQQARALGAWLSEREVPAAVWSSSYLRARQTSVIALERANITMPVIVDERFRDRELGVLDLLTSLGVERRFPEEAERKHWLGKFSYRPPGGESWADLALRLRSVLRDVADSGGGTVMVIAHDAVVMVLLYVLTGLDEQNLLEFAATHTVANASVTTVVWQASEWRLETFSDVDHLRELGAPVTQHPGDDDVEPE